MTKAPATCTISSDLGKVAELMARHDCGAIPVVADDDPERPRGIITDRDIVLRTVAEDINPLKMKAADVMTNEALSVAENDPIERCLTLMQEHQVRRVVVVDETGACCGIVAQADLARHLDGLQVGELVTHISRPSTTTYVPAA